MAANNKSPLSVTGLTLGDTYQWLVAGITGATHINSSIGTFYLLYNSPGLYFTEILSSLCLPK